MSSINLEDVGNPSSITELKHHYSKNIHILASTYLQTLLAKISTPKLAQPYLNSYVNELYSKLLESAVDFCMKKESISWATRMKPLNDRADLTCEIVDQDSRAVVVDLARAGIYPSHLCFEKLCYLVNPQGVRQDHFYINRKVDENEKVIGTSVSGSKIGGDQEGAYVFFPDPMGATGGSLSYCIDHYKKSVDGSAKKYIALHLIVTPEYIKRMSEDHPDVEVFALRVDRGLSDQDVLSSELGEFKEREIGLNEKQYIVPGAGGVGEILNNSFV